MDGVAAPRPEVAMDSSPCIVILGPTCSWKSAAAIEVAQELGGEVISCDSMQVYRGLAIGTAQPEEAERQGIPHHLVGCMELQERWDANRFVPAAQQLIAEIRGRGRVPIVVGGTGLYARALCYGFQMLPGDPKIAAELRQMLLTPQGIAAMRQEFLQAFPIEKIPEHIQQNPRHLARALEVYRITGQASWELQPRPTEALPGFLQFCILPESQLLRQRIPLRTAAMLQAGWVDECRQAVEAGLLQAPTAWQALGYREIHDFLAAGGKEEDPALQELLATRTWQYARRQLTWFRHQHPGAVPLPVAEPTQGLPQIVRTILQQWREMGGAR